jgi:phosphoglycerate dehydrogenase-like enzyme
VLGPPRRAVVDLRDVRPIWALPDDSLRAIRGAFPSGWEVVVVEGAADGRGDGGGPSPEALEAMEGAEVYFGYGVPLALFRAGTDPPAGRLRWAHSAAAGVGGSLYPEMLRSPVVLTNSAGIHAEPMAESVMAMILHFARGLDFAVCAQREGRWWKDPFEAADAPVGEVSEATIGIVGLGGIGAAVARRAVALGARTIGVRRRPGAAPQGVELLDGEGSLERLLTRSDYVVLSVPETSETRGLLGARRLAMLRREAVLVNVSRGRVVDEEALTQALQERRLRGAALDVFEREPLPADSPLWRLPNVLVTPHVSATSRGFWRRQTALILENVRRYLAGEPLLNVVDKTSGY